MLYFQLLYQKVFGFHVYRRPPHVLVVNKTFPAFSCLSLKYRKQTNQFCYRISISCPNQSFKYKINDNRVIMAD